MLYENYYRKYHPKNCSLTDYFNRKLMEFMGSSTIYKAKENKKNQKLNSSVLELPLLRKGDESPLKDKWINIIKMTEK